MNRDEITAKIAELEKKIQISCKMPGRMMPEKLQDALGPVILLTAMRCALAVAAVKEHTSSGCTEHLQSMDLWTRLQPYQELP